MPHVTANHTRPYTRYKTLIHSSFQETSGSNWEVISSNIKTWRFKRRFLSYTFWSQFFYFVKSWHNVRLVGTAEGRLRETDYEAEKVRVVGGYSTILSIIPTILFKSFQRIHVQHTTKDISWMFFCDKTVLKLTWSDQMSRAHEISKWFGCPLLGESLRALIEKSWREKGQQCIVCLFVFFFTYSQLVERPNCFILKQKKHG